MSIEQTLTGRSVRRTSPRAATGAVGGPPPLPWVAGHSGHRWTAYGVTMTKQLIGRSSAQRALDEAVATMQERPCAVVLEGDAGIGKTSLWDHACRCAARAGVRVLVARSASSESAFAFAVLGDLLAPVLEETLG